MIELEAKLWKTLHTDVDWHAIEQFVWYLLPINENPLKPKSIPLVFPPTSNSAEVRFLYIIDIRYLLITI